MNIYLIGMRAVGKSTVGRSLAGLMRWPFIDLDRELASAFGQSIAEFVRSNGWEQFRRREAALVARVAGLNHHIVATGGGVAGRRTNVSRMRTSGWVVWLRAGPTTLKHRMLADSASSDLRPPLGVSEDPAAELESLLQAREAVYRKAMHAIVDTENRSIETICRQIMEAYPGKEASPDGVERLRNRHGR
jgi:shikimate kinase